MSRKIIRRQRKWGIGLLWAIVTMVAVMAVVSLSVDYGRAQLAKSELRRAADAAARAGAYYLGDVTAAENAAVQYAAANTCLGDAVVLQKNQDIEFGDWDPALRTFTPLTGSNRNYADSLRVTARRITTRQNAIPLMFGWIVGQQTCDVQAVSIVSIIPSGYGLVGLNFIKLSGNSSASYWSDNGNVSGNAGNIASNGDITSTGTSTINGTVNILAGAKTTGVSAKAIKTMSAPLSYPNGDASPYSKTINDNAMIQPAGTVNNTPDFNAKSGQTVTVPAGHYVFNNFTTSGSAVVNFTGPATVYYYGKFDMGAKTITNGNAPKNLRIVAIPKPDGKPPGSLTLSGSSALYADVYAPQADVTLSGSGAIYGSVIGKSITMSGTSDIYYDLDLTPPGGSAIALVK